VGWKDGPWIGWRLEVKRIGTMTTATGTKRTSQGTLGVATARDLGGLVNATLSFSQDLALLLL